MITKTISHDGVTVALRRKTWGDDTNFQIMVRKLTRVIPPDYDKDDYWREKVSAYAMLLTMTAHTTAIKGAKWELPNASMTPDEIVAACEKLMSAVDKDFAAQWYAAADELEKPLNDPELAPPDKLTEDQRQDPL